MLGAGTDSTRGDSAEKRRRVSLNPGHVTVGTTSDAIGTVNENACEAGDLSAQSEAIAVCGQETVGEHELHILRSPTYLSDKIVNFVTAWTQVKHTEVLKVLAITVRGVRHRSFLCFLS